MPNNDAFWTPVPALSLILSDEVICPADGGVKLTAIVHDAPPPARVLVQVVFAPSIW